MDTRTRLVLMKVLAEVKSVKQLVSEMKDVLRKYSETQPTPDTTT